MNGFNHDVFCATCLDRGVVETDYADEDGAELAFCERCQLGQELAEQYSEPLDVEPSEEPVSYRRAS